VRRASLATAAVALALGAGAASAPAAPAAEEARTEHVRVRGDLPKEDLEALARLAEAVYPQWKAYFGAEPRASWLPLEAVVLADRESFLRAVKDAGGPSELPGAGGFTWTGTLTSYLYLQPHASSTRLLLLHELTHQFQFKAVQDGRGDRSPPWHLEGLAEHFGYHRRTKDGVETGALDVVAIDARGDACAERVRAKQVDLWAIGTGAKVEVDYTDALAAVETFLKTSDKSLRAAYREWEADVHRSGNPGTRFEKAFRGKKERLAKALDEVWGEWRRPWKVVYVSWDEEPGAIVGNGRGAVLQGTRALGPAARVEAEVELDSGASGAALALAMKGPQDFLGVHLRSDGEVVLGRRREDGFEDLGRAPGSGGAAGRAVKIGLALEGQDAVVSLDGLPAIRVAHGLSPQDLEGGAGLVAEGGRVWFRGVATGG
jgi:hypothetical protein